MKKAVMAAALRFVKRLNIFRSIQRYIMPFAFVLFVCFLYSHLQSASMEHQILHFNFSTSEAKNLRKGLMSSNGFLVSTRVNRGKTVGSAVCVVDPAITDCQNMGFAAFLLYTLDHIILCRALEINRPTVFWRACNSVCSRDPRVNSWDWYFEPVNHGLEWKVENVICLLKAPGALTTEHLNEKGPLNLRAILDNSFKNRNNVEGFETSKIITTQERLRVNKLINQYVKPNARIKEKVEMFYQQYLAGLSVLGIHVRGTDHWMETSEKRLPPLMSWVKRAQSILETLPQPRKIFIASDNHEVIKKFVIYFGKEMVIFTDAFRVKRYHDQIPPHGFKFEHNAADPYEREIGTQVLMDILLLAKCDQFLHTESSVASLASYFNPHMTSYFLQDEKTDKEQEKVRERISTRETGKIEQEKPDKTWNPTPDETDGFVELVECFQRNSAGSACANTAKGIFVSSEEARGLFKRLYQLKQ